MPRRNFYVILGIPPDANDEAIRSAYRDLAKRYHPDRAGTPATSRFREIAEAYRVLSDPQKRSEYNRELRFARPMQPAESDLVEPLFRGGRPAAEPLTPEPVAVRRAFRASLPEAEEEFFDWVGRHLVGSGVPKSGRVETLNVDVLLSPEEARTGGLLPIRVPGVSPCRACEGSGRQWLHLCATCGGGGLVYEETTVRVRIPGMVTDGAVWEVPVVEAGLVLCVRIRVASE